LSLVAKPNQEGRARLPEESWLERQLVPRGSPREYAMDSTLLLTPLVLIAVVFYVAWPLLKEDVGSLHDEGTELEIALEEKDTAIANLKDIEMDYRMGKLSDGDYESLRNDFEARAVSAIKKLESVEKKPKQHKSS
jgi:hypothetical protein